MEELWFVSNGRVSGICMREVIWSPIVALLCVGSLDLKQRDATAAGEAKILLAAEIHMHTELRKNPHRHKHTETHTQMRICVSPV